MYKLILFILLIIKFKKVYKLFCIVIKSKLKRSLKVIILLKSLAFSSFYNILKPWSLRYTDYKVESEYRKQNGILFTPWLVTTNTTINL